jgi:hypothetical protein
MSKAVEIKMYKKVKQAVEFGRENWAVTEMDMK